jgi:hypothetical protein
MYHFVVGLTQLIKENVVLEVAILPGHGYPFLYTICNTPQHKS